MTRRLTTRLALAAAVSALALTGTAGAQQDGDMQDRRAQMQQMMQDHHRQMHGATGRQAQGMEHGMRHEGMGHGMQQQGMMQRQGGQAQQMQAPMEYQQLRGTIADIRRVRLRGQDQRATLVLLETEQGNRAVVDLGTDVAVQLREGNELSVRGRPVTVGDRKIVLQASAIRYDGQVVDVNRPAMQRSAMAADDSQRTQQQGRTQRNQQRPAMQQDRQDRQQQAQAGGRSQQQQRQQGQESQQQARGQQMQGLQFSNLDRNGNGEVTRTEFVSRVRQIGQFDRLDRNGDGRVTQQELSSAFYRMWDSDGDSRLSLTEWENGLNRYFGEQAMGISPAEWDRNDDDRISRREFRQAFAQSDMAQGFQDGNGQGLDERAFYSSLFDAADQNGDSRLSRRELRQAGLLAGTRTAGAQ